MILLTYQSVTSESYLIFDPNCLVMTTALYINLIHTGAGGNTLPCDIWKELFPGKSNPDLKRTIEKALTLQVYNKSIIPQLGTCTQRWISRTIHSHVHLYVHHLFLCASMCGPFIPMCIYVCTIYSHAHLCVHHLFPCTSMSAPFIPMCIYVCTIYSNVHLCVHHLFPCAFMCASFIPMCTIYFQVTHWFTLSQDIQDNSAWSGEWICQCESLCAPFIPSFSLYVCEHQYTNYSQ